MLNPSAGMASTSSTTLKVVGQTSPARHRLSRTPPRRGKPRKAPPPPPRPRLKDRIHAVKRSPYFVPGALLMTALLFGLLYSAIRISAHQADYALLRSTDPPSPPFPASSPPTPSRPPKLIVKDIDENRGDAAQTSYQGFRPESDNPATVLDEAVRHALEEAWHLPPHGEHVGETIAAGAGAADEADGSPPSGEAAEGAEGQAGRPQRTLDELYADLEELGISAHELQEALDEGLREGGGRDDR
ncbi:hypothetical protein JCM11641_003129 [Rhodosporidiobolus odoratus]